MIKIIKKRANIGLIGCGYWGKNLMRNFHDLGVLKAVSDKDHFVKKKFRLNLMSLNIVVIMSGEQYSHQTKLIYIFILAQIFMLSHIL